MGAMNHPVVASCLAALACSVALSAEQQPTAFDNNRAVPKDTPALMSLTGCLERAPNGTYEIRDARRSPPAETTQASGAGPGPSTELKASAAAELADLPMTWTLKSTSDLAPHVGRQVQVIGRASSTRRSGASDAATTAPPTTTVTGARIKSRGEDDRSVDVQTVRMISQSCP